MACGLLLATGAARAEPLTLGRAVLLARERWPERRASRARADSATARVDLAKAPVRPVASATARALGSASRDSFPTFDGAVFLNTAYVGGGEIGGSVRWTLTDFGRTAANVESAEADSLGAVKDVSVVEIDLALKVAEIYLTAAYQSELVRAVLVTIEQRDRNLLITQGLVKNGLQPPIEELRVRVRADAARRDLTGAQNAASVARARLAYYVGISTETPPEVSVPTLEAGDISPAQAEASAEIGRPEVSRDNFLALARERRVDAAKRRRLPTLSFGLDAGYRVTQRDDPNVVLTTRNVLGGLALSVPLLDFSIAPSIAEARADAAAAVETVEQTKRDVRGAAGQAATDARTARERVAQARRVEEAARQLFEAAQARFERGLSGPLELLDAEGSDAQARVERLRAELDRALATARLLAATGQVHKLEAAQ